MFTSADDTLTERDIIPHRHLFHCYVYQYHLMQFTTSIQDMVCVNFDIFTFFECHSVLLAQRDNPAGNRERGAESLVPKDPLVVVRSWDNMGAIRAGGEG